MIDDEELYYRLRQVVEATGAWISDEADSLLASAATAIAQGQEEMAWKN
jgi:hypothetical protein